MTEAVNGAKIRPKTKAAMKKRPARVKSETGVMAKVKPAEALSNVSNRVKRVFERERSSRSAAHGRLKAVMLQDRTTLAAESLDALKNHLLLLLANYVTVDRRRMEMDIKQSGESLLLTASVRVPLFNEVPGENAPEVPPRANEWLLSHKRTLALKRELLEAVGSYMPIFPDSAEVHEKHYSDYALLLTSVRVADGMGYDEDLGGSSIESLFNGNG